MSPPIRVRALVLFLALFVTVGLAIAFAILSSNDFQRQAAVFRQQTAVEAMRRRGGFVFFSPSNPSSVVSVDLSNAIVDADLLQTLVQCTEIERLTFDGGTLQPNDCAVLKKLPQLRNLSLARMNVMDAHVSRLPPRLSNLSLNGTGITDKSMSYLAAMNGLTSLDIAGTDVTSDGLRLLEPLTSLQTLSIDETCITAESAQSLQRMQLQSVDLAVSVCTGGRTHELLSNGARPNIRGRHPNGYILWEADKAWSDTLAGVVEAVVSEVGLDSEQAARLLEALAPTENWGPTKMEPLTPASRGDYSISPDNGFEIASIDEFLRELQKERFIGVDSAVIRYAQEKFTASDVPKLLDAMRSTPFSSDNHLFHFGPFLLVHHGIHSPGVKTELDRLLAHREFFIRATTIRAFGYGGARPFYPREEWMPSKEADAFAVPRLLRVCEDEGVRGDVWVVLAEIAHRRPEYAAQVLPVLVDALAKELTWPSEKGRYLSRIAEVAPDAAVAVLPKLRTTLEHFDRQLPDAPEATYVDLSGRLRSPHHPHHVATLEALSATASASPALAQEIAFEYLDRVRDRQPIGPFAPLLSPDNPDVTRRVVVELLNAPDVPVGELASVAKKIRDWRTVKRPVE